MFQGKLAADVVPQGEAPHFVSLQIGAFRADAAARGTRAGAGPSVAAAVDPRASGSSRRRRSRRRRQAVDLSQAERIVAVGRGIKAQEHIALAQALAEALGAELAASRPICDAGWLPMERQIGSSGQTVAPKLYVAVGISGAIQHVVGMKGARTIVAINKDAEAPIFEVADYGIVGDLFEVVPAHHGGAEEVRRDQRPSVARSPEHQRAAEPEARPLARHRPQPVACSLQPDIWTARTLDVDVLIVGGGPGRAVGGAAARAAAEGARRRAAVDRGPREGARGRRAHAVGRRAGPVGARGARARFRRERARRSSARSTTTTSTSSAHVRTDPAAVHAAAAPQPRQLRHLAQPLREVARGARRSRRHRPVLRVLPAPRCCSRAIGSSACAPATAASASTAHSAPTFEAGVDIRAKVTIFADGVRGNLTKQLLRRLPLARGPPAAAVRGRDQGTVGGAADRSRRRAPSSTRSASRSASEEFGGGFIYAMPDGRLAVGLVAGLDYQDPLFDPHAAFQHFKQHPLVSESAARRADGALRREGAAGGRLAHDPALRTWTARSSSATRAGS